MKLTPTPIKDLENALRLLGKSLPETDAEIEAFINKVDSGEIELPPTPAHLTPAAIAAAVSRGRKPQPFANEIPFPQSTSGIEGLKMAARNGDGPLSEETIRKMKEAQED